MMLREKLAELRTSPDKYVLGFYQKLIITISFFNRNELRNHAAAGSFYLLLSLIPLVLLLFYIFDSVLKSFPVFSDNLFVVLQIFNENLTPAFFDKFGISRRAGNALGVFGLLNLFISSRLILASIQRAFSVIFPASKRRNFILESAISLGIFPVIFVAVILISTLNSSRDIIFKYLQINGIATYQIEPLFDVISYVVPAIGAFAIVFMMFRYLPVRRPSSVSAAKGAILFLVVFIIGRFFGNYLFENFITGSAYGLLGTVMIVLIWSYFVFVGFFFCAQYTYVTYKADTLILDRLFNDESPSARFLKINKKVLDKYTICLPKGETLFEQGDTTNSVHYMLRGSLDVYRDGQKIGIILEGEVFGEMALVLGEPRSATIIAKENSEVVVLPPKIFNESISSNFELSRRVMKVLCMRVKSTHNNGNKTDDEDSDA